MASQPVQGPRRSPALQHSSQIPRRPLRTSAAAYPGVPPGIPEKRQPMLAVMQPCQCPARLAAEASRSGLRSPPGIGGPGGFPTVPGRLTVRHRAVPRRSWTGRLDPLRCPHAIKACSSHERMVGTSPKFGFVIRRQAAHSEYWRLIGVIKPRIVHRSPETERWILPCSVPAASS